MLTASQWSIQPLRGQVPRSLPISSIRVWCLLEVVLRRCHSASGIGQQALQCALVIEVVQLQAQGMYPLKVRRLRIIKPCVSLGRSKLLELAPCVIKPCAGLRQHAP